MAMNTAVNHVLCGVVLRLGLVSAGSVAASAVVLMLLDLLLQRDKEIDVFIHMIPTLKLDVA